MVSKRFKGAWGTKDQPCSYGGTSIEPVGERRLHGDYVAGDPPMPPMKNDEDPLMAPKKPDGPSSWVVSHTRPPFIGLATSGFPAESQNLALKPPTPHCKKQVPDIRTYGYCLVTLTDSDCDSWRKNKPRTHCLGQTTSALKNTRHKEFCSWAPYTPP